MECFIILSEKERKKLFSKLKKEVNSSWEKIYPSLKISRPMFFNYLSGKNFLPEKIFLEILGKTSIKNLKYERIYKAKNVLKEIKIPKKDIFLAEAIGVLNGDGYLSKKNYEISVVGNLLEEDYFKYLKDLFEKVFQLNFNLEKTLTYIKLRTYSKNICNFLNQNYSVPLGKKVGNLKIPEEFLGSEKLLICYLKGLFDTDGGFNFRRKNEGMVHITSADPNYLSQIEKSFKKIGFKISKTEKKVTFYGRENIKKFFRVMKPSNSKHLKKYQNYLTLKRG